MAPIKTFTVNLTSKSHTKAILTPSDSSTPSYELELSWLTKDLFTSSQKQSIVLRSTSTSSSTESESLRPIIGSCILPFISLSKPIQICLGDPDTKSAIWETMPCRSVTKANGFELSLDLGGAIGRRTFDWKRTSKIDGVSGTSSKEIDPLNFKMVDRETGRVVARFVHHIWYGKKRGVLEIGEFEGGDGWEVIVVLSGMAVLEYSRKIYGYSF
ncbi:hypothetical protein VTL71DRAFT_7519 [Oculimacula yallundae]|uniref:Uncharacterized protein n=1 Tax=Oculimacula yallundae TaxID=86028 RepID=A0ABR4BVW2_9HELO